MLLEFSVGNFRSIKEIQTLSFLATPIVSKNKDVDTDNVFQATSKVHLLKSLLIYGANASGKSNLIKALTVFRNLVQFSVEDKKSLSSIESFAFSTETVGQPSFFQIFFKLNSVIYRYGIEVTAQEIVSEWLFGTPNEREVYYFKRERQAVDFNKKYFGTGQKLHALLSQKNPIFRKNALLLSTLETFNDPLATEISGFLKKITVITGLVDTLLRYLSDEILFSDPQMRQKTSELLQWADIGLTDLQIVANPEEIRKNQVDKQEIKNIIDGKYAKQTFTFHKKFDEHQNILEETVTFNLDQHESEGTRKLYVLAPYLFMILKMGGQLIIDEFDARLHPRLSKKIIELFNNPKTNPQNAQLLVVTHDTNLLSAQLLRRDQILFVEKDKFGASQTYSLAQFKGVRNDASFEQDYLLGKYGAVPILNHLNSIFE